MRRTIALVCAVIALTTPGARALDPLELDPIEMAGTLQFLRKAGTVDLYCGQIASYRPDYILSGTLVFQLWASTSATNTPSQAQFKMCEVQLGKMQGHTYVENVRRSAMFRSPPPGTYYILFVLGEWDGFKYVPIDWYMFSNPKTFSTTKRVQAASERIPGT